MVSEIVVLWIVCFWLFFLRIVVNRLGLVCFLVLWVEQGVYIIFEFFLFLFIFLFSHVFVCYGEWICDALNCMLWFFFCVLLSTDWVWFVVWFCELGKSLYFIWVFFWQVFECYHEWICGAFNCMILIFFLHIFVNIWGWFVGWFCELSKESTLYLRLFYFYFFDRYLYSIR